MMDAKWLYTHHKKHAARLKILDLLLEGAASDDRNETLEIDLIESMAFRHGGINGMPVPKHKMSDRTGQIALCKEEALNALMRREADDLAQLRREKSLLLRYEGLFYTTLDALNETERELVLLHYDKGIPLSELTDHKFAGKRAKIRTLSGLKSIRASAIAKAQALLGAAR